MFILCYHCPQENMRIVVFHTSFGFSVANKFLSLNLAARHFFIATAPQVQKRQ